MGSDGVGLGGVGWSGVEWMGGVGEMGVVGVSLAMPDTTSES